MNLTRTILKAVSLTYVMGLSAQCPSVHAEVPAVTAFSPAGLQQGTKAELKLIGKVGTLPVTVMSESSGLTDFVLSEKGDQLSLTAASDAEPGIHWLRFFNADGATSLLPIHVGTVPEIQESEPNNAIEQATLIESLPVVVNGVLHKSGEVDTYRVVLQSGQLMTASVDANSTLGSPMDAVLQILDERGFVIAQNDDDHGFDPLVNFIADREGEYYVRVFCFPAAPNSTINFAGGDDYIYRLTIQSGEDETIAATFRANFRSAFDGHAVAETDFNGDPTPIPLHVSGRISTTGEADRYPIVLTQGDSVRIRIAARAIASHLDPMLRIRQPDGGLIKESDDVDRDHLDVDYLWKAPADGNYVIEVTDRYGHGGERYSYDLLIARDEPRVELSVAADHFLLPRDKPLEIPITINRVGGFAEELTFEVLGLPAEVKVETPKSEAKGDSSKKVTIKLTAETASAANSPFEIIGTTAGDSPSQFQVTTGLKVLDRRTDKLWLTIPPKTE